MAIAYKRLGAADLAATTNTSIYTVPASTEAIATVNLCNRNSSSVTVRLAISTSGTPSDSDYIEYGVSIPANGVLERSGLQLDSSKVLVAYASTTGVSAVVWGMEKA